MSKYESRERKPLSFITGLWAGIAIATSSNILVDLVRDDDNESQQVQLHNQMVEAELSEEFHDIGELVLNPVTDSFTFKTNKSGFKEICAGEYQIEEDAPRLKGDITCTRTIERN